MNVTNVDSYVEYFRRKATGHRWLNHDPQSETADALPGTQHFARWNADEVVSGLRSKVSFPALLLELYEVDTAGGNAYDIKPTTSGAFTVLAPARAMDYICEQQAYATAERIVYDVLQQIWQDHHGPDADQCQTPFSRINFNRLNITPVAIFDAFGWRCMFDFELQHQIDITKAPDPDVFAL